MGIRTGIIKTIYPDTTIPGLLAVPMEVFEVMGNTALLEVLIAGGGCGSLTFTAEKSIDRGVIWTTVIDRDSPWSMTVETVNAPGHYSFNLEGLNMFLGDFIRLSYRAEIQAGDVGVRVFNYQETGGGSVYASIGDLIADLDTVNKWNEALRCKVNPVVGQAGIAADAGVTDGLTTRVILASDDTHFGDLAAAAAASGVIHGQLRYIGERALSIDGKIVVCNTGAIAGTVTANAGTNLNTSLLALEAGGNLENIKTAVELLDDVVQSMSQSLRTDPIAPAENKAFPQNVVDDVNLAAATHHFPSVLGAAMLPSKDMSFVGQIIDGDGTIDVTFWGTNDEDLAAGVWINFTPSGYRTDLNRKGFNSISVTNGGLTFGIDFDNLNYSHWYARVVCNGATNTVVIKQREKAQ